MRYDNAIINGDYYLLFFLSGLTDWEDAGLLAQVLAASQQEYLDNLKKNREVTDKLEDDRTDQYESKPDTVDGDKCGEIIAGNSAS